VVAGPWGEEGQRTVVEPQTFRETASQLVVRVDAPPPGLLVWSRTFVSAWKVTVDGVQAAPTRAGGHLVGVPVPAGRHEVGVCWSAGPVFGGLIFAGLGVAGAVLLSRG